MTVTFTIPQLPKAKMRHQTVITLRCSACQREQVGQRDACSKCGNSHLYFVRSNEYTPKEQRDYERFAAMCAQQGMQGKEKFVGPVEVHCDFYFGIPKSRKKLKDGDYHTQRPDLDNCIKSIWDGGLNQVVIADDCMVAWMRGRKFWTTGVPRTEVRIESL